MVERHYGYPKRYKTSNEKGATCLCLDSATFPALGLLAKMARETSLDGLDWVLAILIAAEHAVEPCGLVHVGVGGRGRVLLQAPERGKTFAEVLRIVGRLRDLWLV